MQTFKTRTQLMMGTESSRPRTDLTAVVYAADGVRFVATASSAQALTARIATYIRQRCDDVLWPDAALETRALLAEGKTHAAIAVYFHRIGERWDEERLELFGEVIAPHRASADDRVAEGWDEPRGPARAVR